MSMSLQDFFLFSIPFILVFLLIISLCSSKPHKNLPPSPPKLPLIGNLHQLVPSTHRALHTISKNYGPLMLLRFGTVPVLVASSVDAAREIMKTHDLVFANRPKSSMANRLFYDSKDIAFAEYGEYWRQVKSIAVIHLLSNKRVQSYRHVREDQMALMIQKIQATRDSVVNLSELIMFFTNNVISTVVLGRTYDGRKFKKLIARTLRLLGSFSVGSYVPSLKWVDRLSGLDREVDEVAKEFDEFWEGVIDEHLNKKEVGVEGQDIVDILLEIQKDNSTGFELERNMIKAIILDLFIGGTDTTFASLEWAFSELLRHPFAMKKLQKEAQEIGLGRSMIVEDDLNKMLYLKAVIKETLRLHPPLPILVPHESTQDVKLLNYDIPSGTQVIINAWAIGRDPSKWEEPEKFIPERFLSSSIDYKGLHFELIPFGAGRRGCPGIYFATIINELVLANLVYKFELGLPSEDSLDMCEGDGIAVHRKWPLVVTTTPLQGNDGC